MCKCLLVDQWPETHWEKINTNFKISYDYDLDSPFRKSILSLDELYNNRFVLDWLDSLEDAKRTYFDLANSGILTLEDPFIKRRKNLCILCGGSLVPKMVNTTVCFSSLQQIYYEHAPVAENHLMSVLKVPDSSLRIWGYIWLDGLTAPQEKPIEMLFIPVMFDQKHIAWPTSPPYFSQLNICQATCSFSCVT